jgi:hypothetical protein
MDRGADAFWRRTGLLAGMGAQVFTIPVEFGAELLQLGGEFSLKTGGLQLVLKLTATGYAGR